MGEDRFFSREERQERFERLSDLEDEIEETYTPVPASSTLLLVDIDLPTACLAGHVISLPEPARRVGFFGKCALLGFRSTKHAKLAMTYINGDDPPTMGACMVQPDYTLPPLPSPIGCPTNIIRLPYDTISPTPHDVGAFFDGYLGSEEVKIDGTGCLAVFGSVEDATSALEVHSYIHPLDGDVCLMARWVV